MLTDPTVLTGDSASSHSYSLVSITDGNSVRKVPTAPTNAPETMQVKHQLSSRGGIPLGRHTLRLDLAKVNADNDVVTASVYVVVEVPEDAAITAAMLKDMRTQLVNFLTVNANFEKILNGEP